MFWGSSNNKSNQQPPPPPAKSTQDEPAPAGKKLPTQLQQLVDHDHDFYDDLYSP
jgi:hypothetical protein